MNPFRYGEVVVDKDFCPRPELLAALREHIEASRKVVVLGERRTGKTSLIFEAARRMSGLRMIYAQLWAVKSVADVADRLIKGFSTAQSKGGWIERVAGLLARLRPTLEYDPLTGAPSLSLAPGTVLPPSGLHAVLDAVEKLGKTSCIRHVILFSTNMLRPTDAWILAVSGQLWAGKWSVSLRRLADSPCATRPDRLVLEPTAVAYLRGSLFNEQAVANRQSLRPSRFTLYFPSRQHLVYASIVDRAHGFNRRHIQTAKEPIDRKNPVTRSTARQFVMSAPSPFIRMANRPCPHQVQGDVPQTPQ